MNVNNVDKNKRDVVVSVGKGASSMIPIIGPLVAELIDNLIPNHRFDRLTEFVKELDRRLSCLDDEKLKEYFKDPECVDMIEEGFWQAARALSKERREYIASIIEVGLSDDELAFGKVKYLLKILGDLNDEEVLWLQYIYLDGYGYGKITYGEKEKLGLKKKKEELIERHKKVFFGLTLSSSQIFKIERNRDQNVDKLIRLSYEQNYKNHLVNLGLIIEIENVELAPYVPPENQIIMGMNQYVKLYDNSNLIKNNYVVTVTGALLLACIGLALENKSLPTEK